MQIKDSGVRTEYETGAVRDIREGKGRYDLLPWDAIHEWAIHCEQGALKYGERNCEKGIPIHSLIDSAIRHLSCYLRGERDEPHLRAALWNVGYAIWMEKNKPEMQDIPARLPEKTLFTDKTLANLFRINNTMMANPIEEPKPLEACATCECYVDDKKLKDGYCHYTQKQNGEYFEWDKADLVINKDRAASWAHAQCPKHK